MSLLLSPWHEFLYDCLCCCHLVMNLHKCLLIIVTLTCIFRCLSLLLSPWHEYLMVVFVIVTLTWIFLCLSLLLYMDFLLSLFYMVSILYTYTHIHTTYTVVYIQHMYPIGIVGKQLCLHCIMCVYIYIYILYEIWYTHSILYT